MNNQDNYQLEHWWDVLQLKFDHSLTLRNHYETMANFGATVQTGLFAGIFVWNIPCPPTRTVVAIFFGILWLLIHVVIRWQLRNRRFETLQYNALDSALRKWANEHPTNIKLKPSTNNTMSLCSRLKSKSSWLVVLDLLLPYLLLSPSRIKTESEKLKGGYPQELVCEWDKYEEGWVIPILHAEFMYCFGSFLMLVVGLCWILNKF